MSIANPNWSPDGSKIAFNGGQWEDAPGRPGIYVMNADGTNPVDITHKKEGYYGFGGTGAGDTLDWQPLPRPTEAKPEKKQEQRPHNQQQGSKRRSETVHPPDTGGPSLLLISPRGCGASLG